MGIATIQTAADTGRLRTDCGDIRIPIDRQAAIYPRSVGDSLIRFSAANACTSF